ncbi:MAG: hypothetical protein JO093_11390 [Acidobacteria bacterium]|nr:hypothetical protein [Acidobacteriota bacterium]MBV9186222.1 hypothetical protein [Acidobacteriota bacterium]
MRLVRFAGGMLFAVASLAGANAQQSTYSRAIPPSLRGPFVSDPAVVMLLDCPTAACDGQLNFARLMQARSPKTAAGQNPFNLPVAAKILATVESDLTDVRVAAGATEGQLNPHFLTDLGSRVELVGAINRMDRQFIKDPTVGLTHAQLGCGEVSLIYRFSYSIRDGKQASRLPVTLNMVFPALPSRSVTRSVDCADIAQRWLDEGSKPPGRTPQQEAADLLDKAHGPLAYIDGRDLIRLELNMQAYRKGASSDDTDFGTAAAYLIRVFKWDPRLKLFLPEFLRDQIDRTKVLCSASDTETVCAEKQKRRKRLVRHLSRPDVMASIDKGTLEVPYDFGVLATRALSISPGGLQRSANQPYWKALTPSEEVISDDEIAAAMASARAAGVAFSFVKSVEDFRTRLNETSCTGCHQTRAIAGFHFPGADRPETPAVNAVLLPGSPQFYGDQPRRQEIVTRMAKRLRRRLSEYELATSYSARPMNRFAENLRDTQLVGGWGGACIMPAALPATQRQWMCREELGLTCTQLFTSANDPNVGTCIPSGRAEVGDPLQRGNVVTAAYGLDKYTRTAPVSPDQRIPASVLPSPPPAGNAYYGAHQEFYEGNDASTDYAERRDALTGGFPAGMLRLSECIGLPPEATCGLIASSGFNSCIGRLASDPTYTIGTCFSNFTSYAGIRACNAATPCRDDYICVMPMGYTPATAQQSFADRATLLASSPYFQQVNKRPYDPNDFGQKSPDAAWIARDDQRGLCIPPYFVFQFRSDGHPAPPELVPPTTATFSRSRSSD